MHNLPDLIVCAFAIDIDIASGNNVFDNNGDTAGFIGFGRPPIFFADELDGEFVFVIVKLALMLVGCTLIVGFIVELSTNPFGVTTDAFNDGVDGEYIGFSVFGKIFRGCTVFALKFWATFLFCRFALG